MSLINKMLQDLDARGGSATGADPSLVKAVARPERQLVPRVALAVALVALLAVGGWYSWRTMHRLKAAPPVAVVAKAPMPLAPVPPGMVRVTPPVTAPAPAPARVAPPVIAPAPARVAPAALPVTALPLAPATVKRAHRAAPVAIAAPVARELAPVTGSAAQASHNAEADYRRALSDLQEGRVTDAIAALERTLQTDPRHDSARQILVGLLVEAKRTDDAMRQLQLGLGLDPRQPAMAMLLARLQLESGVPGAVDTLLRTLPYAGSNGEYQAFLAGVLQRQGRNGEAVVQYQAALAAAPGNPVWLMGLGIALQADQRKGEALTAFQRASAIGTLSGELQAFVERKIVQLKQP